jgi:AcrR family transcriptional regulator
VSPAGRRPGAPDTREAILTVARRQFATRGYDATSLRVIAAETEVDPALVIHYFGTKDNLFIAATGLPAGLPDAIASLAGIPVTDFPAALVRAYLELVDSDDSRNAILALVRSAVSHERAAAMLREFLTAQLLPVIARLTPRPPRPQRDDARLRAALVAAQLIGIAVLRHVIQVEPLAMATPDDIVALAAPAIGQYLR